MAGSRKDELEALIRREKTVGTFIFDEDRSCFVSPTEIHLCISKVADNIYKPVRYFFDGYEVWVDADNPTQYIGPPETAMQLAIEDFNQETFQGYPVIFENITCEITP